MKLWEGNVFSQSTGGSLYRAPALTPPPLAKDPCTGLWSGPPNPDMFKIVNYEAKTGGWHLIEMPSCFYQVLMEQHLSRCTTPAVELLS